MLVLIRNSGRVVDRRTISRIINGFDKLAVSSSVDVRISHMRKNLGKLEGMIRTAWGVGYEFVLLEKS